MYKEKIDFEIVPIFDQSTKPGLWHDFTELEIKCDSEKYGYNVDDTDRQRIFKSHMYDWANCKHNMAFAAYHENKIVGFATAYKESKTEMYLRNLYVLPQYEGMGIGRSLLEKVERASRLVAKNMNVTSLNGALSFYESRGYTNFDNRNMTKKLPKSLIGVVPVFQWYKFLKLKMKVDVDHSLLIHNWYQPIFVYVSPDQEIVGVGVRTKEGKDITWADNEEGRDMMVFYKSQLLKALSKVH